MRKFFLKVTGKPSVEEKEEDKVRKEARHQVEQVAFQLLEYQI